MKRLILLFALTSSFACKEGPEGVDATVLDTGFDLEKDAGEDPNDAAADAGVADTGTTAMDASQVDSGANDAEPGDGLPNVDAADADQPDAEDGDGAIEDDAGVDLDGAIDPDAAEDAGPVVMIEDFTDPVNEAFACPDGTTVLPGLSVENGTQCLGIDGSGCPDERGLPGPGTVECADPNHNPFIGLGQCVSDFFACFDPMGTCTNDGMGTFTWGNGARQIIQVDAMGRLVRSEFIPSNASVPCIVGLPEMSGGTRVIYTQQ